MNLRCPRGCDRCLSSVSDAGVMVLFCDLCRSSFCGGTDVARWLGRELTPPTAPSHAALLAVPTASRSAAPGLACPHSDGELEPVSTALDGAFRCSGCGGVLVEAGVLPRLRALAAASLRPPPPSLGPPAPTAGSLALAGAGAEPELLSEHALTGARLAFHDPRVDLCALPAALLVSSLVLSTTLGRMLVYPVQLQFHELGHALFAWLSSRAAFPLPFGFTFWREEKSLFTGLCMLFLLGVLGHRGYVEQRKFPLALALFLALVFVWLSLVVRADTSLMLMLAGGLIGELFLPSLALCAFYFPMPDRLRWDFFRFVMLGPAMASWLASATMWFAVARGSRPLPMGSILGSPGDGSGDLERLIAGHGFTPASLTQLYLSISIATALLLLMVYAWFARNALTTLGRLRMNGSKSWPEA